MVVVVNASEHEDEVEAVTKKWGLEAGLWKVFRSKPVEGEGVSKMDTAKKLLKVRETYCRSSRVVGVWGGWGWVGNRCESAGNRLFGEGNGNGT